MKKKLITLRIQEISSQENRWIASQISEAVSQNQKVLPVVIDSPGGEVYALMSLIDMLKNSGLKIITVAIGKAMSCGAVLLSIGDKRYISENATAMIHQISAGTMGTVADMNANVEQFKKLNAKAFKMLNSNCNQKQGYFENLVKENPNVYLDAEQALECGLATNIGIPTIGELFSPEDIQNLTLSWNENEDTGNMKVLMMAESFQPQTIPTNLNDLIIDPKEEGKPQMTVQNPSTPTTPSVGLSPELQAQFQALMTQNQTLMQTNNDLQVQMKAMSDTFDKKLVEIQDVTEKKVASEYQTKFEVLNSELGSVKAERLAEKKLLENEQMDNWLVKMHQVDNKITFAEIDEMKKYMTEYTSTDNGSRQAYMKQIEARQSLSALNQSLPDTRDLNFTLNQEDRDLLDSNPHMKDSILDNAKRRYVAEKNNLSLFKRKDKAKIDQLVKQLG